MCFAVIRSRCLTIRLRFAHLGLLEFELLRLVFWKTILGFFISCMMAFGVPIKLEVVIVVRAIEGVMIFKAETRATIFRSEVRL